MTQSDVILRREAQLLVFALLITNLLFTGAAYFYSGWSVAANVLVASLFLTLNFLFYMVLAAAILVKKNIAWMGPVIVIKYLILIGSVYVVWAKCDVLLVLASMFAELLAVALVLVTLKWWFLRRENKDGSF